jgi:2,3,4,5-tetrahydropyridine-2,6-dicarboxylate N-succinyltransferase
MLEKLRETIEEAWAGRQSLTTRDREGLAPALAAGLAALDDGIIRAAACDGDRWIANEWVQKLIMLIFICRGSSLSKCSSGACSFDKLPLKFDEWDLDRFIGSALRVVPGAIVRRGAYIGPNAVLMPCFVNIGAYVGAGTMIDTWATVGSCAQIGNRCHISGGAGIGGVLEPIGNRPVIIEDDVFVGARAEIAEGVWVQRGAVIGMGVYIGSSTPIIDRATGCTNYGVVPADAVVVAGGRSDSTRAGISTYAAIIVKRADRQTRSKTQLNEVVRR